MIFPQWLESKFPGLKYDDVLDVLKALSDLDIIAEDNALQALEDRYHDDTECIDNDNGDWQFRLANEEYHSGAREAAREMERIRRSGL